MPPALTFPGVYVQEIPSGVRTITGVSTSIAAFVGKTARGPVNKPVTITSVADYERTFGPLSLDHPLGFAVRDFYLNGGAIGVVVRAFKKKDAASDVAQIDANLLLLEAATEGTWSDDLRARMVMCRRRRCSGRSCARWQRPHRAARFRPALFVGS